MPYFFRSMGFWIFPMSILTIVIIVLSIKKAIDLFAAKNLSSARLENGLHAIIFWGGINAVLGVLGQVSGIYNAMNAIARAAEISPKVCAMGFAQSFTTTIFGIVVFMFSSIIWFAFFARYRKLVSGKA